MERKVAILEGTSESAERLSDLLTLSYEPMLAWRLDGVIEFWNTGAERLYGFAPDEAVGRSSHSLLQTKFPIEFIEFLSQLRSERYWSGELRHICKDGHEVIVDSRMQLFGDDTVLEVNRDITDAKALIARQASCRQIETLFNQSGIFAGILDLEGYMREVNNLAVDGAGTRGASPGPAIPGDPLVARVGGGEGADTFRDPSGCFGLFSAKSFDTGWLTAVNELWTLR